MGWMKTITKDIHSLQELSENRFRELNDTLESASAEIGKLLDKLKADIASKSQVADSTVRTVDEK